MSAQPISRNRVPISMRLKEALHVALQLEKKGMDIANLIMRPDHAVLFLNYPPTDKKMVGENLNIYGGPTGLWQAKEFKIGNVRVQWVVPYVHLYVPINKRVH